MLAAPAGSDSLEDNVEVVSRVVPHIACRPEHEQQCLIQTATDLASLNQRVASSHSPVPGAGSIFTAVHVQGLRIRIKDAAI